eukprot:2490767-Alexandrium_andersonii.AAC.1
MFNVVSGAGRAVQAPNARSHFEVSGPRLSETVSKCFPAMLRPVGALPVATIGLSALSDPENALRELWGRC